MNFLSTASPEGMAILATVIAIIISENLTLEETGVIGSFITGVGSILFTIAAQEQFLVSQQSTKEQNDMMSHQIEILRKQVDFLKNKIDKC